MFRVWCVFRRPQSVPADLPNRGHPPGVRASFCPASGRLMQDGCANNN